MAVNVKYQYRRVPIDLTEGFFTAYMGEWMRARIPLVQAKLKRGLEGLTMQELLDTEVALLGMERDITGREMEQARVATQVAGSLNRDLVKFLGDRMAAESDMAVARENRIRELQVQREEAEIDRAQSANLSPDQIESVRVAIEQPTSALLAELARVGSDPQARLAAWERALSLSARAMERVLPTVNEFSRFAVANDAASKLTLAAEAAGFGRSPEEKAALADALTTRYWNPLRTSPAGGASLDRSTAEAAGLAPLPRSGGITGAPVPVVAPAAAPAPAADEVGVRDGAGVRFVTVPAATAPASDRAAFVQQFGATLGTDGRVTAPGVAPMEWSEFMGGVREIQRAQGSAPAAAPAPAEGRGLGPHVVPGAQGSAPLSVGRTSAGTEVLSPSEILARGTPIGREFIEGRIDPLRRALYEELDRRRRGDTGPATLDLREPKERPLPFGIDKAELAALSPEESHDLATRMGTMVDEGPGWRAREERAEALTEGAASLDVAVRAMAPDDPRRPALSERARSMLAEAQRLRDAAPAGERALARGLRRDERAQEVLAASAPPPGPGESAEASTLDRYRVDEGKGKGYEPTETWVDKAARDADLAKLAAAKAAGLVKPEEAVAKEKAIRAAPSHIGVYDEEVAESTADALRAKGYADPVADKVAAIVTAAGGDPAKVARIREKAPGATADDRALQRGLEEWEREHAEDDIRTTTAERLGTPAEADLAVARAREEEARAKAEAAKPGPYEKRRAAFLAGNEAETTARKEREAALARKDQERRDAAARMVTAADDEPGVIVGEEKGRVEVDSTGRPVTGPPPSGPEFIAPRGTEAAPDLGRVGPRPIVLEPEKGRAPLAQDEAMRSFEVNLRAKRPDLTDEQVRGVLDAKRKRLLGEAETEMYGGAGG